MFVGTFLGPFRLFSRAVQTDSSDNKLKDREEVKSKLGYDSEQNSVSLPDVQLTAQSTPVNASQDRIIHDIRRPMSLVRAMYRCLRNEQNPQVIRQLLAESEVEFEKAAACVEEILADQFPMIKKSIAEKKTSKEKKQSIESNARNLIKRHKVSPFRLLIVEDDRICLYDIRLSLEQLSETHESIRAMEIHYISDAFEALDMIKKEPFHMLLTDFNLGPDGVSGIDLIERNAERFKAIGNEGKGQTFPPFHVLQSNVSEKLISKDARWSNVDYFIAKPILTSHLEEAFRLSGQLEAKRLREVVMVEDNVFVLGDWQRHFKDVIFTAVPIVQELNDVVEEILRHSPDCLLLDYYFDQCSYTAVEVLKLLKKNKYASPVYIMTNASLKMTEELDHLGVKGILGKDPTKFAL